jgi:prevent-host-death family protein
MILTASQLRSNIYQILDRVLKTGEPVGVSRHGKIIKIIPPFEPSKLDRIKKMGKINGDPESLVHMDWTHEWKGSL